MKCPKCQGEMEEGTFASEGSMWIKKGLVSSLEQTKPFFNAEKVTVYRCKSCGYLESYAK